MLKNLIFLGLVASVLAMARYDNYRLVKLKVDTPEQLEVVQALSELNHYIFWEEPKLGADMFVVIPPHKESDFAELTAKFGFGVREVSRNLQAMIDATTRRKKASNGTVEVDLGWEEYHTLEELYEWMDLLAEKYPGIVEVIDIGRSYEGRRLRVVKLSRREGNPGIFCESNIHAREWISSAVTTWTIHQLLFSTDEKVQDLAWNIDWYFLVVANPDGFVYTKTNNRLWRKTRQPYNSLCTGADPNRNFEFKWRTGGSSTIPCSDTYAGPAPFSERETAALANFINKNHKKFVAYFDFHSYTQLLLYPYGSDPKSGVVVSNREEHIHVGERMTEALAKPHGTKYTFGETATTIYVVTGGSADWVKGVYDVPFSFVYELRDEGQYGFVLPPDQIIPNAEEVMESLKAFVESAREIGYFPKK